MIVDSSALVAISQGEPGPAALVDALARAESVAISASALLEARIVVDARRNPVVSSRFDDLLISHDIKVLPFTEDQSRIARQAYRDFGRGSGHPANLNYGDCFSYALASERREPLLYVGDDFSHTDIRSALET